MRQADASNVRESTPMTGPAAPLQPELSSENRQHNSNNTIVSLTWFEEQTESRALDSTDGHS
eukprot:9443526-Pyramimonas_sp.AAC.1